MARNKLNNFENLMSQALKDFDISHEEFKKIIDEKEKYEQIKENIKNTRSINEVDTEDAALNKENNQVTNL